MTFEQLLTYVRVLLQDQEIPYRHSDAKLMALATSALQTIHRKRPDLVVEHLYTPVELLTEANISDTVPIHPAYTTLVGDLIVFAVELSEDESTKLDRIAAYDTLVERVLRKR